MKDFAELVIVMPIGPNTEQRFIIDTLESVAYYITVAYKIILVDDSHQGIGKNIQKQFPETILLSTQNNNGGRAGLYLTLCLGYQYALRNFTFSALLKLDTDALLIGFNPQNDATELFKTQIKVGMAGQYPLDYNNRLWNRNWPKDRINNATKTWKFFRRPFANFVLHKYYRKALVNNYETGESVFGGSYFMSENCLQSLYNEQLLPNKFLGNVNLEEDHLFSLLVKACGFNLGNLSTNNLPFACAWKGLPASPEELYRKGKKIIHSTRKWNDMNEDEIRNYFRKKRITASAAVQIK